MVWPIPSPPHASTSAEVHLSCMTVVQATTSQRAACLHFLGCFRIGIPEARHEWQNASVQARARSGTIKHNNNIDESSSWAESIPCSERAPLGEDFRRRLLRHRFTKEPPATPTMPS